MKKKLVDHLSCLFCGGNIEIKKILQEDKSALFYGLLMCTECKTQYPVIEGIPIMMSPERRLGVFDIPIKSLDKEGISVLEICKAFENDEIEKVKETVVYFIPYPLYSLPKYADVFGNLGKRAIRKIMRSSYFDRARTKYAKRILEDDKTTAYKAMGVYYQDHELFNYFFYKFGQPRFLTSLNLVSLFNSRQKPVLDLACGLGHLMHFLTSKYTDRMAIGVDRNFFQLIVAKKYIAPEGQYICADADSKLPFRENTFGGIICSDAFHFFPQKSSCIRDLKEIMTDEGTVILNRVGNQYVAPNEGIELTPKGYLKLFNPMTARMVGENNLLDKYLMKKKPNLADVEDINQLKNQKWLTVVASNNKEVFKDHGHFDEWPHRVGKLALNPLYKKTGSESQGNKHYKFSFPSDWYKFEDSLWQNYAPEKVKMPKGALNALKMNGSNAGIEKYIDQFVIMGFPENYM